MNVFGKKERSWRKARKRGVSPIIATILLVAITVVLAAVLYVLISGLTKGPGSTPLGTALALGTPAESSVAAAPYGGATAFTCAATCYTYAFTLEQAGGGITWNSVNLVVKNSAGTVAAVSGFIVWNIGGPQTGASPANEVAFYNGVSETAWSAGAAGNGATPVATTQTLIVYMSGSASDPLSGQTLFALGVAGYSGTVQIAIP